MEPTADDWVFRMPWSGRQEPGAEPLLSREWLVTNGLGGYASGTIAGAATRRYHSLLIAALAAPLGRQVMLNHLWEVLRLPDGSAHHFGGAEHAGKGAFLPGAEYLTEFRLESGLPVWRYEVGGFAVEKRVVLPRMQNTVHVGYRIVSGEGTVRLHLRPSIHFRAHDAPVTDSRCPGPYRLSAVGTRYELAGCDPLPPLRLQLVGERPGMVIEPLESPDVLYRVEESRGYDPVGKLWSPGYFRSELAVGREVTLVASTESWDTILALQPAEALRAEVERRRRLIDAAEPSLRAGPASELVLAADQFVVVPAARIEDATRARAAGDEARTVIAGYHWFTDWGRDTMISLEGLTLVTGRAREAGYILRTFGHHVRDGLIPNLFPEGGREGLYHTADATLWFFHALHRYLAATGEGTTLRILLPKLKEIVDCHLRGTHFGIGVDPKDGLLRQGAPGYQLTWMDAKVGDWVVTPRRGKAVEINALWYNALRLLERWLRNEEGEVAAAAIAEHGDRARRSFNERFWYPEGIYLYDVVDGEDGKDDPALRPNQIFAISLDHPVLERERWQPVLDAVTNHLLTPVGLRSLAPGHPDYKSKYYGDVRARDAAYHQGTVWGWLIGPYVDAWLKLHPEQRREARRFLDGFFDHLGEACVGSISEVFDAEPPYTPRGCIAQAWSVAEVLRSWAQTAETSS
jgi:predicted glycogen debranching enzyme